MTYYEIEIKVLGTDNTSLSILTGAHEGTPVREVMDANRDSIINYLKSKLANQAQVMNHSHFKNLHASISVDDSNLYITNASGTKLLPTYPITRSQTIVVVSADNATFYYDPAFSHGLFGSNRLS